MYTNSTKFENSDRDPTGSIGVLLTNLGTPQAPTTAAVRSFLAQFLWDPRVIELPRPIWWLILHCFVLRFRPRLSAEAYRSVWTQEGSPLLTGVKRQAEALSALAEPGLQFAIGMRYGEPSIASGLDTLAKAGVEKILVLPLYPQYSATTTASTFDAVAQTFQHWRQLPSLAFVADYHDDPAYIESLVLSIRAAWEQRERPERLLFSFHGIPRRYVEAGDKYESQCLETVRLVTEALELTEKEWHLAFQSRVGREEWLKPYTDEVLAQWGREKLQSVEVICPGFSSDCLETLEEIDQRYRHVFHKAGGGTFHYIPALNDSKSHILALRSIVRRHLGWE